MEQFELLSQHETDLKSKILAVARLILDTKNVYLLSLGGRAKIDGLAIGEEVEVIKELKHITARLMDWSYNCSAIKG